MGSNRRDRNRHDDEDARDSRRGATARQGREPLRELRRSSHARSHRSASSAAEIPRCRKALTLAQHVARVIVLHRGTAFSAQAALLPSASASIRRSKSASTRSSRKCSATARLTGVRTRTVSDGKTADLELAGLFVYVGLAPATAWLNQLARSRSIRDGSGPTVAMRSAVRRACSRPGRSAPDRPGGRRPCGRRRGDGRDRRRPVLERRQRGARVRSPASAV